VSTLEDAARRVQRGDVSAFREIVEATSTKLVRLSARMMGSVAEAEDVVQDAYVKAYRAIVADQFDARSRVETWLHRIVVNASVDAKRKRARVREDAIDSSRGQEGNAETAVALRELAEMLGTLPEDQRAALVLKADGMSATEIGAVLGCTEGAVEQKLVRARATLRERRS
jgi:RNA polymerase sigma-70 factor (ECF subfamily)